MIRDTIERICFAQFCIVHRRSLKAQKRWQERHLRALVQHAGKNIPLWRALFDSKGVDVTRIRSLDNLSMLPITGKQTYLGRVVEEYIDPGRPTSARWYVTSGTSGMPLAFLMSEKVCDPLYKSFLSLRFLWWRGEGLRAVSSMRLGQIKVRTYPAPRRLFLSLEEYLSDPVRTLRRLIEFDAEILSAYPSILLDIARGIEKGVLPHPKPKYVLSFGETLSPWVRAYVADVLGVDVYDRYGLEEIGAIGIDCQKHDGFHINTESVVVEVVDEEGQSVVPGVEGRIIATNLLNDHMPFIRYDTGDRGRISFEPCPCGLRSPRLWVKGRGTGYLDFPRRRIHHLEFDGAMDIFMNQVFKYQIAKRSDTEVVARIIPGSSYHDGVRGRIVERLQALLGPNVRVSVEQVETLSLTPRGKSRVIVDESSPRTLIH